MNPNSVAVVKVNRDIQSALNHGLDLLGGFKVNAGERVVIKPNLCHKSSSRTGATTDVRIVQALVQYLLEKERCSITIVESDSYARGSEQAFKRLGYRFLEGTDAVRLANLSQERTCTRDIDGRFFKEVHIPESLMDYDCFITVAKLKTSIIHRMTGAYKNQYGCLAVKEKRPNHPFLSEALFDLNMLFRPSLCIVDGIVGMEGCGPTDGSPKRMNIIVLGWDAVTVDAVLCYIMGIDPFEVPHLKYAFDNGIGELRKHNIDLLGEPLENVKDRFVLVPERAYAWMNLGLRLGRYPSPIRNLGVLLFTWGNYQAGKKSSMRTKRHLREGKKLSAWSFVKKALWTRRWNV